MKKDVKFSVKQNKDYNIASFKEAFIVRGPMQNVLALYNFLINHGVIDNTLHKGLQINDIVLLCRNNVFNANIEKYATVELKPKQWYNCWHNPKYVYNPLYKTYGTPVQNELIFSKFNTVSLELLIPEELA